RGPPDREALSPSEAATRRFRSSGSRCAVVRKLSESGQRPRDHLAPSARPRSSSFRQLRPPGYPRSLQKSQRCPTPTKAAAPPSKRSLREIAEQAYDDLERGAEQAPAEPSGPEDAP